MLENQPSMIYCSILRYMVFKLSRRKYLLELSSRNQVVFLLCLWNQNAYLSIKYAMISISWFLHLGYPPHICLIQNQGSQMRVLLGVQDCYMWSNPSKLNVISHTF